MAVKPNALQLQLVLAEEEASLEASFERYEQGEINLTEARLYAGQQIVTHEIEEIRDEDRSNDYAEPVAEVPKSPVSSESRVATRKRRSKPWRPPKPRTAYQRMIADRRGIPDGR